MCASKVITPFDVDTIALTPFAGGYTQHAIAELRDGIAMAQRNGALTREDLEWLRKFFSELAVPFGPPRVKNIHAKRNRANHPSLSGKRFDATEDRD